ncbi:MAG: hypothetical protein H6983_26470 [Ectothiorhodospiraceae bacterium]|nr:hypothetical protein [Ectothiorhodospiraceae bacterium]
MFAVCLARLLLFTEARFQWQQMRGGRPGALFGTPDLEVLEVPWRNGTTGDLLARWEQHASFAGNGFVARRPGGLRIMRPDWTGVVMSGEEGDLDSEVIGYIYWQGGIEKGVQSRSYPRTWPTSPRSPTPITLARHVVADPGRARGHGRRRSHRPQARVLRERCDAKPGSEALREAAPDDFAQFVETMRQNHRGVENAWETLYLGGGADVTVVGADMKQLDFKVTQGAGETRIAPPPAAFPGDRWAIRGPRRIHVLQLRTGPSKVRRRLGPPTVAHGGWRSCVDRPGPAGSRLWYDDRDIPFLQEDQKDAADILSTDSQSVRQLTDGSYTPSRW